MRSVYFFYINYRQNFLNTKHTSSLEHAFLVAWYHHSECMCKSDGSQNSFFEEIFKRIYQSTDKNIYEAMSTQNQGHRTQKYSVLLTIKHTFHMKI